jgi:fructose 1,6-bisphosphatase
MGKLLIDHYISSIGDEAVHKLAWYVYITGGEVAKNQGLYGACQDLLRDTFSGNVHDLGPAVAEMEFEERPNEPFLFFAAEKTDPGNFKLSPYLAFAIHEGRLTETVGLAHPFRYRVRGTVANKAVAMRCQGF